MPHNPATAVKGAKRRGTNKKHTRDELTAGEVRRVLATCAGETAVDRRDRALLSLMAYCALRQVELHRADIADLKTRDGRLVLWVQGKGQIEKDEFVVLPAPAETAVREWLVGHPTGHGPLFVSLGNRSNGRLSLRAIRH